MQVRPARADERTAVLGVLDAGLLETDAETVAARIEAGTALVAVTEGRVVGALTAAPGERTRVEAVAVRPNRRGQGVGTALVTAAADRWAPLVADFDERVRPFYESLGFRVEPHDGRYRGVLAGQ